MALNRSCPLANSTRVWNENCRAARRDFKQARLELVSRGIDAVRTLKTKPGFNHRQTALLLFDRPLDRWLEEAVKPREFYGK